MDNQHFTIVQGAVQADHVAISIAHLSQPELYVPDRVGPDSMTYGEAQEQRHRPAIHGDCYTLVHDGIITKARSSVKRRQYLFTFTRNCSRLPRKQMHRHADTLPQVTQPCGRVWRTPPASVASSLRFPTSLTRTVNSYLHPGSRCIGLPVGQPLCPGATGSERPILFLPRRKRCIENGQGSWER